MIIAFTGPAGSGKDTAAEHLVERHNFVAYSFAQPIKEMLGALGLGPEDFTPARKELPLTQGPWARLNASPRKLAQTLGTEWGRDLIGQDLWVRLLEAQMLLDRPARAVITDARFDNEAAWVRRRGGLIIHITRPDLPIVRPHASEHGIEREEQDLLLDNAGPVRELFWALDALVRNNAPETKIAMFSHEVGKATYAMGELPLGGEEANASFSGGPSGPSAASDS